MRKRAITGPRKESTIMRPSSRNRHITGERNASTRRSAIREKDATKSAYTDITNIGNIHQTRIGWTFDSYHIVEALDGPNGNPIDPDIVFPYFPDYTFNGLFPDMNSHADWQALFNILN